MPEHNIAAPERLREIVNAFAGRRVLVVGDIMLDEYVWGEANRISPEAPVMVVEVRDTTYAIGGAGNVGHNIRSLGAHPRLCGVIGDDMMGKILQGIAAGAGIDTEGLVCAPDRPTTVKTRIVAHSQQVVRVDRETRDPISGTALDEMLVKVKHAIPTIDAVILSDYAKGALTDELTETVVSLARAAGKPTAANLKPPRVAPFRGATLLTLNMHEAERASNETIRCDADLHCVGRALRERLDCRALLITRGADGVALFTDGIEPVHIPARRVEVYDVTGAGDAVISASTLALISGASPAEAAAIGNLAGNAKVRKLGVAPVTTGEILEMIG